MLPNKIFSRFFHIYPLKDSIICYNSLTMEQFITSQVELEYVRSFISNADESSKKTIDDVIQKYIDYGFVVDYGYDEMLLKSIRERVFTGVSIRVMVLHMTDFCNLKCKYCFIEGGQPCNYERKNMSISTSKAAVDKFFSILKRQGNEKNRPTIVFYGGEPLHNWKGILETLTYLQEKEMEEKISTDKVIITNGTLITSEIAEQLKMHNVMVSVSLDGIESVHNANRVTIDGKGSFDKVISGIKTLNNAGISPAVSCVMAKEGIDKCIDSVEFLVNDLHITGLGFNHVSIIPGLNYYDAQYEDDFADAIIKVQELIQNKYPNVYERRMGHKVNTFIDKKLIKSDCTGCGEQISISPDGEIGICQGYMGSRKTFVHTVYETEYYPDSDPIFIEWSNRSPLNIDRCTYCPALATCGGGCPRNADMLHGSMWETDTAFCHFAKKAQEWLVHQEVEDSNE